MQRSQMRRPVFRSAASLAILLGGLAGCRDQGQGSVLKQGTGGAASQQSSDTVVAEIDGQTLTMGELDERARVSNAEIFQQLYEVRKSTVDKWAEKQLVARQASADGIEPEALLLREVDEKLTPVGDADVDAFFLENADRMAGQTKEALAPRIRSFLEERNRLQARQNYLDTLKQAASFRFLLDPPRTVIEIAENEPSLGPKQAQIAIVEYSDFQ